MKLSEQSHLLTKASSKAELSAGSRTQMGRHRIRQALWTSENNRDGTMQTSKKAGAISGLRRKTKFEQTYLESARRESNKSVETEQTNKTETPKT